MKYYRVQFETKKHGYFHWVMDTEAATAKEARAKVEYAWSTLRNGVHMFHTRVRVLKPGEEFLYHWFTPSEHGDE